MNKIISFVMVGTNDLQKSSKFYDAVFVHLGMKKVATSERYIGYGYSSEDDEVKLGKVIQNYTDQNIKIIDEKIVSKEKEIMTI